METKFCTDCQQTLPVDQFHPRKGWPGKYCAICKPCRVVRQQKQYWGKPAYRAAQIARATAAVQEKRKDPAYREYDRKISREGKRRQLSDPLEYEKHLKRNREWMRDNPERVAAYASRQPAAKAARARRLYLEKRATPEGRAQIAASHRRYARAAGTNRRARHLKAEGRHSRADIDAQLAKQGFKCFWCPADIREKNCCDHYVPLARGGTNWPDNIVMSCRSCNSRKWALSPEEFMRRLEHPPP